MSHLRKLPLPVILPFVGQSKSSSVLELIIALLSGFYTQIIVVQRDRLRKDDFGITFSDNGDDLEVGELHYQEKKEKPFRQHSSAYVTRCQTGTIR